MKRSKLVEILQTDEFLNVQMRLCVFTEPRLRAGNPWPEGLVCESRFVGVPTGKGDNPRWKYTGLIYQLNGEWYLSFLPESRWDVYRTKSGELLESATVVPWLYKPPEVKVIRSIKLRAIETIVLHSTQYTIEDG